MTLTADRHALQPISAVLQLMLAPIPDLLSLFTAVQEQPSMLGCYPVQSGDICSHV